MQATTNKQNEKCATPMGHLIVGKQNECIISFVKEPRRKERTSCQRLEIFYVQSLSLSLSLWWYAYYVASLSLSLSVLSCFFFGELG